MSPTSGVSIVGPPLPCRAHIDIIVSFVRSTSQDEDVVTSVAKTAGDSVALQEGSWGSLKGSSLRQLVVKGL